MHFTEFLHKSADEINAAMQDFFTAWNSESEQISPQIKTQVLALAEAAKDGKRIRGALVLLGHALVSKESQPELLKIAVAYELFQTAILAHDDIIDNSPKRRGKPSLHMALGGNHYGLSQAICLGDIGFFLAYKLISESSFSDTQKVKATSFFSDSIIKTTIGELLDVELAFSKTLPTQDDVLAVARLKTAYYTFVAPLVLGAILGGCDEKLLQHLRVYGENVGIAFQLQDDITDIFGTERQIKKEVGGDIREGKQTVLIHKARTEANPKQQVLLKRYYGNPNITDQEIAQIKEVLEQTGAVVYTRTLARKHVAKAREVISEITAEKHMQQTLEEVIQFIL